MNVRSNVPPGTSRLVQQLSRLAPQLDKPGPPPWQLGLSLSKAERVSGPRDASPSAPSASAFIVAGVSWEEPPSAEARGAAAAASATSGLESAPPQLVAAASVAITPNRVACTVL